MPFCFRLLGLGCAFACNVCNSLDVQAAGMYLVLEALPQISFLNLGVVFRDFLRVPVLKKAPGKQAMVLQTWRFPEKQQADCWCEQLNLNRAALWDGGQRDCKAEYEGVSVCHEKVWAKPVWEVLTLSFVKAMEPGVYTRLKLHTVALGIRLKKNQ